MGAMDAPGQEDIIQKHVQELKIQNYNKLREQMRQIVARFKDRGEMYKEKATRPLTPNTEDLKKLEDDVEERKKTKVLQVEDFSVKVQEKGAWRAIHPQGKLMLLGLGIQTLLFLYNAWIIPLRFSFHIYQHPDNLYLWALFDYVGDAILLLDVALFKTRLMFLDSNGIFESDAKAMRHHYFHSRLFRIDLASLLPLDLFYLLTGFTGRAVIFRLPRLFRYYNFTLFFDRLDAMLPFPMFIRLCRTVNVMLYLIHLNACAFYAYSDYEGIGSSSFVFNGHGNAYIRCFYVGLKTSISIGINPKPLKDRPPQMIFMGFLWLMGVFVFALLIGNVKDIIAQATSKQEEYMTQFDQISQYMYRMNVPQSTVSRVKEWCQFTWRTQKSFDELAILEHLPTKMRSDVALDVHYETIKNVKLFHGCDPGLIKELVIKLKPIIFLPGDYICKKGDVGKEMFIITMGQVQVVGGPDDSIVFVTLGTGVCFGEIALLGSGSMNRRTANVRAHGFTTLYVLYKEDLSNALNDYPEDKELLARKAKKAAKEVAAKQANDNKESLQVTTKDIIFPATPSRTPMLLTTVLTLMKSKTRSNLKVDDSEDIIRAEQIHSEATLRH